MSLYQHQRAQPRKSDGGPPAAAAPRRLRLRCGGGGWAGKASDDDVEYTGGVVRRLLFTELLMPIAIASDDNDPLEPHAVIPTPPSEPRLDVMERASIFSNSVAPPRASDSVRICPPHTPQP